MNIKDKCILINIYRNQETISEDLCDKLFLLLIFLYVCDNHATKILFNWTRSQRQIHLRYYTRMIAKLKNRSQELEVHT